MEDKRNDEAYATNAQLPSPDSVVISTPTDSNATSRSELSSVTGYHSIHSTDSMHSDLSAVTTSDGTLSQLTSDSTTTPVNIPQSRSDYSGTRFNVRRINSDELNEVATSVDSPVRASSQSPRSVTFVDDGERPGSSRSPERNLSPGLSKSRTSNALSKLVADFQSKKFFSKNNSQEYYPEREELNLAELNRGIRPSVAKDSSDDDEDFATDRNAATARSMRPLLTGGAVLSTARIQIRRADGTNSPISVEEVPNTPGASSADSTILSDLECERCVMTTIFSWAAVVAILVFGFIIFHHIFGYSSAIWEWIKAHDPFFTHDFTEVTTPSYWMPETTTTTTTESLRVSNGENIIASPTEGTTSVFMESTVYDMYNDDLTSTTENDNYGTDDPMNQ